MREISTTPLRKTVFKGDFLEPPYKTVFLKLMYFYFGGTAVSESAAAMSLVFTTISLICTLASNVLIFIDNSHATYKILS